MILDDHQVSSGEIGADAARSIRREIGTRAECMHDTNWKSCKLRRMAFIHVKAAGERDHVPSSELSGDERTGMTEHSRRRKSGDFGKRYSHRVFDVRRESTQTGAEHDSNFRNCVACSVADCIGASLCSLAPVRSAHAISEESVAISPATLSSS